MKTLLSVLLTSLALAGTLEIACGAEPTPTPVPTWTPVPTYTLYPTNTPAPTYTPWPTVTPTPPIFPTPTRQPIEVWTILYCPDGLELAVPLGLIADWTPRWEGYVFVEDHCDVAAVAAQTPTDLP